jgi:hypothetical protein
MLEHLIFARRTRWSKRAKAVAFGVCAGSIVGTFWWFRNAAFGFDGAWPRSSLSQAARKRARRADRVAQVAEVAEQLEHVRRVARPFPSKRGSSPAHSY